MAAASSPPQPSRAGARAPRRVRPVLVVALALSMLLHALWTLWPVEETNAPEGAVLTATLAEMPPPPVPVPVIEPSAPAPRPERPRTRRARPPAPVAGVAPQVETTPSAAPSTLAADDSRAARADPARAPTATDAGDTARAPAKEPLPPAVVLPPRVDLAYKVFFGTQGFVIGDATYRFEHSGDRYRISTVGQARGLAALLVRGTGKVQSHGRITPTGLRPQEFAIERGGSSRREVAFFDWEAGNVVLNDGATAQLEQTTYDPLTILWQPYFSPPGKDDQTFSLATTRKVTRYTLTLQAEETIAWPRGEIVTERWHRRSDDGKTEAWFWLAPSMHHIPVKMRVTRTARGTLEVLLDSIRVDESAVDASAWDSAIPDAAEAEAADASVKTADDIVYGMPGSALPALSAEDLRGQ